MTAAPTGVLAPVREEARGDVALPVVRTVSTASDRTALVRRRVR